MQPLITIWFDDGWETQYSEGYARMSVKGLPGVISVITDFVGDAARISCCQIMEMSENGWQMVNHTATHQNFTFIPLKQVELEISKGMDFLTAIGHGKGSYHIVPPYGAINDQVRPLLDKYGSVAATW